MLILKKSEKLLSESTSVRLEFYSKNAFIFYGCTIMTTIILVDSTVIVINHDDHK